MPEARDRQDAFAPLAEALRPKLYRFCARMVGSAVEGEDVVQDTLIKAMQAFPGIDALDNAEAWLFRIARNAALDHLRRRARAQLVLVEPIDEAAAEPVAAIDQHEAAAAGLRGFMELSPAERGSVILMDVLGYSLNEIADILTTTVPAVKASLHRGRRRLRSVARSIDAPVAPPLSVDEREKLARYIDLFNARDFDAMRDLLAEDVRLDLVGHSVHEGKGSITRYFTNYARFTDARFSLAAIDGVPGILVQRGDGSRYFILLTWRGGRVSRIRDFFHFPPAAEVAEIHELSA